MSSRSLRSGAKDVVVEAEAGRPLLDVLRTELGVRSASRGCQDGSCGACRVIVDGMLVSSCRLAWGDVKDGARVETYDDLALDPAAVRAVDAFAEERPSRCRMCVGALGVTAVAIARASEGASGVDRAPLRADSPSRDSAIEEALKEATCMCTGRGSWRRALSK